MRNRKLLWSVITVGCAGMLLTVFNRAQSEAKIQVLVETKGEPAPLSAQEIVGRNRRARQLYQLWQARNSRDVTEEVIPYLQDSDGYLRRCCVRVLARLDTDAAEIALSQLVKEAEGVEATSPQLMKAKGKPDKAANNARGVSSITLKLALKRLQSRSLKGRARVEAVTKSVGLSFAETANLSQKVNGGHRSETVGTLGEEVVEEVVDLLYMMGRQGEDIQPLMNRLTLNQAQQVMLQSSALPTTERVTAILDYLSHLKVDKGDDSLLRRRLLSLEPSVGRPIVDRLGEMLHHPEKYQDTEGYGEVFRAAVLTDDARAIPLLKQFDKHPNPIVRYYATQSWHAMEQQNWFPPLP